MTLMAGEADQEAPMAPCAAWLNGQLPKSELHSLGRDVGHYTLLCGGTREGRECEPEIWIDAPTVDRRDVHRRAVGIALAAIGADHPAMMVR
ncbi:hypothetical protein [Aureimonas pseudogalii]|uniref:hypothetical protein n=1 Tax=Aureimonas pseudogalii TaxID=1744844 RepID=UPI0035E6EC52